jgi:hypothetical protein
LQAWTVEIRGGKTTETLAMMLLAERAPVLAFVNNHFAGYAHDTTAKLLAALH